jgi:crossover junction endodeoxyribonuclease RusA
MSGGINTETTMEIEFPIEFLVQGTPVSQQGKLAKSKDEWKARVRTASSATIPVPHFASEDRIAITLYYLPSEQMQGDIDNIVKPILDALSRHIYVDDHQVERLVVQKFEQPDADGAASPSSMLGKAFSGQRPVLYVRITNDPKERFT